MDHLDATFEGGFICEPTGEGMARVTHYEQFDFHPLLRPLAESFLADWLQADIEQEMRRLKDLIELHVGDEASEVDNRPQAVRRRSTPRSGSFVARGEPFAVSSRGLPDDAYDAIRDAITVTRRGEADLTFAVQQLLDVTQYATTLTWSDTSTADEALAHLRAVLHELLRNGKISGCLNGGQGRSVVSSGIWGPAAHLRSRSNVCDLAYRSFRRPPSA